MTTVMTHAALGWSLAHTASRGLAPQVRRATAVAAATVACLPDADVIGFRFGVEYGDVLGHRGLSHSLACGLVLGVAGYVCLRLWYRSSASAPAPRPGVLCLLALLIASVSHAVLDMATDGGLGCAFWAPFSNERLFLPVRPVPVPPIGLLGFLKWGWPVFAWEIALFGPVVGLGLLGGATAPALTRYRRLLIAVGLLLLGTLAWWTRFGQA